MDRPSVYAKSAREGIVSTILVSILLSATILMSVTWSQAAQSSDDAPAKMRQFGQYLMQVGQGQYDQGSYGEAVKTFQMAEKYKDYLDPVEQRKLQSLLEKARSAAADQKRTPAKPATVPVRAEGRPAPANVATASPTDGSGSAPAQNLNGVLRDYYESVKAYFAGDFPAAKQGFTKVLQNPSLPPSMAETIRGHLADIDAKQGNVQPTAPAVGVTALANTPAVPIAPADGNKVADTNAPAAAATAPAQSEVERIAELYTRSLELYQQGELQAARQGFVEVAKSGLFKAAPGKRPEDYIIAIDRRLAAAQQAQTPAQPTPAAVPPTAVTPGPETPAPLVPVAPAPNVTTLANGQGTPEEGGSIAAINTRRAIIRSRTETVVNDAVNQAQKCIAEGRFDEAANRVADAQRVVNEAQFYLGDDLYKQYTQRLTQMAQRIQDARAEKEKELTKEKKKESAKNLNDLRIQAETDRTNRVNEYMERAKAYWKQQQFEAALGQLEALLAIEPLNDEALTLKQMVQDMVYLRKQIELDQLSARQRVEMSMGVEEAQVPYADEITYPKDWREVMQRPTRKPEAPYQLDPMNAAVYEQLNQEVDLSQITSATPLSTAVEIIRKSVVPPLNILVIWRDLLTNVNIEPTSPVNMEGLPKVRLGTALDNLVKAISDPTYPDYPVEYVVNKGVVTIATTAGLPQRKMEARVYDITDLVGTQANYAQMGQMMGMYGGGGGMMGGMGGMMGGGMGGMGGMMGGGMGGMGGGMGGMGGMMGGMGGMMGGGMGGMQSGMMAYSLRDMIMQTVNPNSWYDLSTLDPPPEGQITLYPSDMPKKMTVVNTPEVHEQISKLLDELRKALGSEVSIEARFLVVSQNFLESIGLDLDFSYRPGGKWGVITVAQNSILTGAPDTSTKVPGSLGSVATDTPAINVTGGWGTTLDELQVSLLLRATQARTDAKALSAPKVTVMSGEGASFSIYDLVAYALPPTTTTTAAVGGVGSGFQSQGSYNNVSAVPVGSTLSITPTITKDKKYVLLNIVSNQTDLLRMRTLQVTQTNPNTTAGAPATVTTPVTVPETETSNVATRVSVPDRGTLLLGGHKLAATVNKEAGVPILSKIPILGRLFSNRSTIRDEKILLILVKPTIILQDETEQQAIASMEEVTPAVRP